MSIKSYAAPSQGAKLTPHVFDPGPLGNNEVEVAVTHCGICHSDIHLIDNDWGISSYPLVPGHEIVGTVTALGKSAKDLRVGQRVGIGWQAGSCMKCEWCKACLLYTSRAHETRHDLVCRLLLEKKKKQKEKTYTQKKKKKKTIQQNTNK